MSKTASDHLFLLIRAMSQSEKRYFRRFLQLYGGKETACGKLFDAFSRQKVYDEAALKRSATFLSGFAQHKKRLTGLLLRSLRSYHAGATTDVTIKAHLVDAEIFRQKRLYAAGISSLQKARKLARATENHLAQLDALNRIDELRFDARQPGEFLDHANVLREERALLEKHGELARYKSMTKERYYRHYFDKHSQNGSARAADKKLQKPSSFQALRYYLNTRTAGELNAGRKKQAYRFAVEHVKAIERHPLLLADHPYEYVKALSTQLVLEDILQLYPQNAVTIAKMRQLHRSPVTGKKLKLFESHTFTYTYTSELNALLARKAYAEAARLIPVIVKGLEKHGEKITAAERKVFHYNFSLLQLYTGNARQAFSWATKSLAAPAGLRADLDYTLHLVRILATYERNDPDFFATLSKKEGERLLDTGLAPKLTKQLVQFFRALSKANKSAEVKTACTALLETLKKPAYRKEMAALIPDLELTGWIANFRFPISN
jgi:hypothetical protein